MSSYEDLLKKSYDELPEEKNLPVGTWRLRGRSAGFMKPNSPDQNARCVFFYVPQEPMDNVSPDALSEITEEDIANAEVTATFWIEKPKHLRAVVDHMEKHGIEVEKGVPLGEAIMAGMKKFKGCEVLAHLDIRTFQNRDGGTETENKPSQFTAIE